MLEESTKVLIVAAALTCLVGCVVARPDGPRTIPADGVLSESFGRVPAGEVVERTFVISNPGTQPLGLEKQAASCDCLVSPSSGVITAGRSLALRMRAETRALRGSVELVSAFKTTDPERPLLQLRLAGEVLPPVQIEPAVLYFGRVRAGGSHMRRVVIEPARPDVRIRRVSGPGLGLRKVTSARDTEVPAQGLTLEVYLPTDLGPGGFEGQLLVETNDERLPAYAVPVLAIFVAE